MKAPHIVFAAVLLLVGSCTRPASRPTQPGNSLPGASTTVDPLHLQELGEQPPPSLAPEDRLAFVARRWDVVRLAVGHADVVGDMAFSSSMRFWQGGYLPTKTWTVHSDQDPAKPLSLEEPTSLLVRGDCGSSITISQKALVHIYGNLSGTIALGGNSEVVVGGTIESGAGISCQGRLRVFVGGGVDGFIHAGSMSSIWIAGDLTGEILTGNPSTQVHIMGDLSGAVGPTAEAALLYLDVRGFASSATLDKIAGHNYTQFNATIGASDQGVGLHPSGGNLPRITVHCEEARNDPPKR